MEPPPAGKNQLQEARVSHRNDSRQPLRAAHLRFVVSHAPGTRAGRARSHPRLDSRAHTSDVGPRSLNVQTSRRIGPAFTTKTRRRKESPSFQSDLSPFHTG